MTRCEVAQRAIRFQTPPYIPILRTENLERADICKILVENHKGGPSNLVSEWGFEWEKQEELELNFGQTKTPVITDWDQLSSYNLPPIDADLHRFDLAEEVMKKYPDRYYMADFQLSGFTIAAFVRGFEDLLMDFYLDESGFCSTHLEDIKDIDIIVFARLSNIFTVIISSAKIRIRDEITKFYQCFFYEMRKIVDTQWSFFTQNKVTEYILGNKEQRNSDIFS